MSVLYTEGIKLVLMRTKNSLAKISEKLGFKQRASLSQMLVRGTIRMNLAVAIVRKCGYRVWFLPDDVDGEEVGGIEVREDESMLKGDE